jgi:hypothetical protein
MDQHRVFERRRCSTENGVESGTTSSRAAVGALSKHRRQHPKLPPKRTPFMFSPLARLPAGRRLCWGNGICVTKMIVNSSEVVRTFWHGGPLDLSRLACLQTFALHGHRVELYSYENIRCPNWITRRNAAEILPTDQILRYQLGEGAGGVALHANLFRYALLYRLGGWWIDCDIILREPSLPANEFFCVREDEPYINNAIIKFPAGHPLMAEAIRQCMEIGENAVWGQTGPRLFSQLLQDYQLASLSQPAPASCPLPWWYVGGLLDPDRLDEVTQQATKSKFVHLCAEVWRRAGVSTASAPPQGSFLQVEFSRLGVVLNEPSQMNANAVRARFNRAARNEFMCRMVSLEQALDERSVRLLAVEQTLHERDVRLASLEAAMEERDHRLRTLEDVSEKQSGRRESLRRG